MGRARGRRDVGVGVTIDLLEVTHDDDRSCGTAEGRGDRRSGSGALASVRRRPAHVVVGARPREAAALVAMVLHGGMPDRTSLRHDPYHAWHDRGRGDLA